MDYFKTTSNVSIDDPDHVYLDISMINDDRTGLARTPDLYFNENRNNPILASARDYYLSVVRFNLQTASLPIFLPQVDLTQSDPSVLIYKICLTYDGIESPVNLVWIPQDFNATPPNVPLNNGDINSSYYNCYSYQHFIFNVVNKGFLTAFNNLVSLCTTAGKVLPTNYAPFLEWDVPSLKAILDTDVLGYDPTLPKPIEIYFNSPLYTLFSSFDALYYGNAVTNGKNYKITILNMSGGNIYTLNNVDYLQQYQEYATAPLWNPIQSIVFTSSLLPVVVTQVCVPKIYNNDSSYFTSLSNSNFSNMVTDFTVGLTLGSEYKPLIQYNPTAQYRYIDLTSNSPLQNIDISVYWKDNYNTLHPLTLQSQCSCNIKILFKKKSNTIYKF
jgi:hypothetical protein